MTEVRKELEFNKILLEAIDEALLSLGELAKSSLYLHLQNDFALPKNQIPFRIVDFVDALERIFGQAALQLQILIMKCLNEKVQGSYEWSGPSWLVPDLTFAKYVRLMQLYCTDADNTGDVEVFQDAGERKEHEA
ncbi:MAG TPA: hypothetical protein VLL96_01855 [Candidatus Deferrimicrobiaceae bacterium]|nr:hypothetical protein [Candidatus Deferrimicrobiaceae bacterium]